MFWLCDIGLGNGPRIFIAVNSRGPRSGINQSLLSFWYIKLFSAQLWHLLSMRSTSVAMWDQFNSPFSVPYMRRCPWCPIISERFESIRICWRGNGDTTICSAILIRERRTRRQSVFLLKCCLISECRDSIRIRWRGDGGTTISSAILMRKRRTRRQSVFFLKCCLLVRLGTPLLSVVEIATVRKCFNRSLIFSSCVFQLPALGCHLRVHSYLRVRDASQKCVCCRVLDILTVHKLEFIL